MINFLTEKYTKLAPYVPGEQPKDKKYIKLNTNESPFPPSPLAVKLANDEAKNLMKQRGTLKKPSKIKQWFVNQYKQLGEKLGFLEKQHNIYTDIH